MIKLPFLNNKTKKTKIETPKYLGKSLSSPFGYQFTPSFIKVGGRYATIVKVGNKYGTNRGYDFGWFVRMIPEISVEGVKSYFFETDKLVTQAEQANIMKENVAGGQETYINGTSINVTESENEERIRDKRIIDYKRTSALEGNNQAIIDCKLVILLVGDNPDAIAYQLKRLQSIYDDKLTGIELQSIGGEQQELLSKLFNKPDGDIYDYTFMASDFAGNDHAVRKGLDDPKGWAIGTIAMSHAKGEAFMALNQSFKKKILVTGHKESSIQGYSNELSSSSLWGQLIANNAMVDGHKVYHIVLNNFKYYHDNSDDPEFLCPISLENSIERVDLSKGGLNPLEMFGEQENVISIYNSNIRKIAEMFYLQSNRKLSETEKNLLISLLNDYYINQKLWHRQAKDFPERLRVIGMAHDQYGTLGDFINGLNNAITSAKKSGTETEINELKNIYNVLKNSLDSHSQIFNNITTLSTETCNQNKFLQHYYDLSGLRTEPNIMEAQFLNTFDFSTQSAKPNDIIMIHGMDKLSIETIELITHKLDILSEKGVRLAYLFDTISSGENEKKVTTANIFNTDGILYNNFEGEFDYTIIGSLTKKELEIYEKKIHQKLTDDLKEYLTSGEIYQYQIRRKVDNTSNLIYGDFII